MKLLKNGKIIATHIQIADSFIKRMRGLLPKTSLDENEGLVLINCNSIHSFKMKFDFDAIYLNKKGFVVYLAENIKPNKVLPIIFSAKDVLELQSGFINKNKIKIGDKLTFE